MHQVAQEIAEAVFTIGAGLSGVFVGVGLFSLPEVSLRFDKSLIS